jgi:predicted AAA+ superfamily ATPase
MTGEPLTGRKYTLTLYPLSEREFLQTDTPISRHDKLRQRLIYGNYPELLHIPNEAGKRDYLYEIISSYLLRDILVYENIRHSSKIFNLLRLIAFQTGNLVSVTEIGTQLSLSKNTVEKYLDLLSKVFILYRLEGFSRNLRKEITKNAKWYFFDNGIRNAIIADFKGLENRSDVGQLWENYLISERLKYQQYNRQYTNNFFWRTYDQQEVDWVEERDGTVSATEFKWTGTRAKPPSAWSKGYPDTEFKVINNDNYLEWLT